VQDDGRAVRPKAEAVKKRNSPQKTSFALAGRTTTFGGDGNEYIQCPAYRHGEKSLVFIEYDICATLGSCDGHLAMIPPP